MTHQQKINNAIQFAFDNLEHEEALKHVAYILAAIYEFGDYQKAIDYRFLQTDNKEILNEMENLWKTVEASFTKIGKERFIKYIEANDKTFYFNSALELTSR